MIPPLPWKRMSPIRPSRKENHSSTLLFIPRLAPIESVMKNPSVKVIDSDQIKKRSKNYQNEIQVPSKLSSLRVSSIKLKEIVNIQ